MAEASNVRAVLLILGLGLVGVSGSAAAQAVGAPAVDPVPLREAEAAARSADLASQRLLRVLDEARLSGDRRGMACVDRHLTQVNSFTRMIFDRRDRLRAANERGDTVATGHERTVLRNLRTQLEELERAGRSCIHPEAGEDGVTIVEVIIEPGTPIHENPAILTDAERNRGLRRR